MSRPCVPVHLCLPSADQSPSLAEPCALALRVPLLALMGDSSSGLEPVSVSLESSSVSDPRGALCRQAAAQPPTPTPILVYLSFVRTARV